MMKLPNLPIYSSLLIIFAIIISGCQTDAGNSSPDNVPAPVSLKTEIEPTKTISPTEHIFVSEETATSPSPQLVQSEDIAINPLTGLECDPQNLNRRPVLVKVENLPRDNRPQFGLSLADHVFEYHTEEGTTRFAAVYYCNQAEKVGPIRSGRMFDARLIHMYDAFFVFGSAYITVLEHYANQDFNDRLIVEGPYTYPALFRYEPQGKNILLANTNLLTQVYELYEMTDERQDLSGLSFSEEIPDGGEPAHEIFVRFSPAIYNRWDYDAGSGRFFRYADAENDLTHTQEVYEQLFDRLTGEPIQTENLVILFAKNYIVAPNIYDVFLEGMGDAYIIRDGILYKGHWMRPDMGDMLLLTDVNGNPFPLKPGRAWFEVMSLPKQVAQDDNSWRFTFQIPVE